ncbi:peptigoglycan-binding protein LysM [Chroococcidiopsis sp. CCALA 051]|uniref:LysM peptidoglycan-binding domain-containing protein n=1 Tax=Chroococcidiopsis sp. CCALA 051 TaxID=869949 RepID=UPI000D0CD33F|nr:LysM peptidoglycan-binding domain-containing protein [Chroococcidiopsis sp. CCALA 051]PSM48120.1 peptigoglycan-binding protein LysM [Chroococcidiopsis sp. CCALA 051]
MTHLLNCPVCGYKEIAGNSCPNCDTDISLLRSLAELPTLNSLATRKITGWQVGAALIILIMGIGLGTLSSFLFFNPAQLLTTTINSPSPVVKGADPTPSLLTRKPVEYSQQTSQPTHYVTKPGDSLSKIAERFYGNAALWNSLVEANPKLTGRENFLVIGELLLIPKREEACRGSF